MSARKEARPPFASLLQATQNRLTQDRRHGLSPDATSGRGTAAQRTRAFSKML